MKSDWKEFVVNSVRVADPEAFSTIRYFQPLSFCLILHNMSMTVNRLLLPGGESAEPLRSWH
jgi:hypothetical protein